jgi:hypothetical protein
VEDALSGQEVSCPECQQPVKAPAAGRQPPRTSGYALASVVLALTGAFTVVGTVAAVVLGGLALTSIARSRGRLSGAGFAVFGIVAGTVFTFLTVLALSRNEIFGLDGWVRERTLAGQVDTSGPLEVDRRDQGYTIARPSERWGRVRGNATDEPALGEVQRDLDLLLLNVRRYAYVDVRVDTKDNHLSLDAYREQVILKELRGGARDKVREPRFGPEDDDEDFRWDPVSRASVIGEVRPAPHMGEWQGQEVEVKLERGGQRWWFLVRVYRKGGGFDGRDPVYVVRGYTPWRQQQRNRAELERALDSFRIER